MSGRLHVYVIGNNIPQESVIKVLEEYEDNPLNLITVQCTSLNTFIVVTPEPQEELTDEQLDIVHELDAKLTSIFYNSEFLDQGCYNPAHEQCYASHKDCVVINVRYLKYKNADVYKLTLAE